MLKRLLIPVLGAIALGGCDAATQIAGEAVEGEVRNAVAAQCLQIAEGTGMVAARVNDICECSADTFLADPDLTLGDVSRENIEGIVNRCAGETGATPGELDSISPTEEIGG